MKHVNHVRITKNMSVKELLQEYEKAGVMGAGRIGKAASILTKMIQDKDCTIFFAQAGAMIPGGMKDVIHDILKTGRIGCFATTGATLTHDMVEALGYNHIQGKHDEDDAKLHKQGMDRMWDSYMPNNVYEGLEEWFNKNWNKIENAQTIPELLSKIGEALPENSILNICWQKKIQVFCPALADSGIGLMIWGRLEEGRKINVKAFEDLKQIIRIAWDSKKNGVLYVGGGTPKNYCQQAMQFSKQAVYAIQISTDVPEYGGSSGAPMKEGISWGKLSEKAQAVDVYCDATIALPLIWAAVKE
ncbi:deoxyhypusine synthase family protein [Candidatus Woesearchaeota archaeon]|nr:deoxyhypusine synthase family protein [Candidatus Woesearchaeota archaeon]